MTSVIGHPEDRFSRVEALIQIRAATCDFQQYGILITVDSDEPMQPPFKLRNSK